MYSKDLVFEKDFNDAGKKTRYYSFHESGQLVDEVNKISTPNVSSENPNYLRNMFASAVGDIDTLKEFLSRRPEAVSCYVFHFKYFVSILMLNLRIIFLCCIIPSGK